MKLEDLPDDLQQDCRILMALGKVTRAEVDAALAFMDELAELELAGALSKDEALQAIATFANLQLICDLALKREGRS